jgi:hypothetical protein
MLFGRAPISYAMKFAHVLFELMHLIQKFMNWGWSAHALLVSMLAVFAFLSSLNMPCAVSHSLTSLGALLDTVNFLVCALVPRKTFAFWLLTLAFFFHATYIWAFLVMANVNDKSIIVMFRSYGVYANCVAIVLGSWSIAAASMPEHYGSIKIVTRLVVRKTSDFMTARGRPAAFLLHEQDASDTILIPSEETYFPTDSWHTFLMHLLCATGNMARIEDKTLKWLDFEETNFEVISTQSISVKRPTVVLLWLYKGLNWVICITLFHAFTEVTLFLPALILSWLPVTLFAFVSVLILFRR